MILRFCSGSATPASLRHELFGRVDMDDLDAKVLAEGFHDLFGFIQPQQAGIDKHAGQLVADGAVYQRCGYRGIDATGQAQNDFIGPTSWPESWPTASAM
jgi:hypothetical protein